MNFGASLIYGMKYGFLSGTIRNITKDLGALSPTIFSGVPNFYNRYFSNINRRFKEESDKSAVVGKLIDTGVNSKVTKL